MNEPANDGKAYAQRVEQFTKRIRKCKNPEDIFYAIAFDPDRFVALFCSDDIVKEQIGKVMSAGS